jgi:putative membrane protein
MFIDYLSLLLINTSAGFFLLATYIYQGLPQDKKWVPPFLIVGLISLLAGLHMSLFWPLPGSYNLAFGELSCLLGALFLGLSLSLAKGWELRALAIYAFFAGLVAVIVGIRLMALGMTREPLLSGIGFILSGLSGILAYPLLMFKEKRMIRIIAVIVLVMISLLWLRIGLIAYWQHLSSASKWLPSTIFGGETS